MIKLINYDGYIKKDDIKEFIKRYELKLPIDYVDFLLTTNGGMTDSLYFEFEANWDYGVKVVFFSLQNLENRFYNDTFYNDTPENIFPIGEDQAQNLICISLKDDDYGKIYFWEAQFVEDIPDYSNIFFIADNLEIFFNMFKKSED